MLSFGKALGRLRAGVRRDLKRPGLPREKVLALVVKLLDATQVRVGNAEYARSNGSFGLTTLRNRHARFPARGKALLQFRGKGGAEHEVLVDDARLAQLVRRCQELPGQALFQYVDEQGSAAPSIRDRSTTICANAWAASSRPRISAPGTRRCTR